MKASSIFSFIEVFREEGVVFWIIDVSTKLKKMRMRPFLK